jgi:hypothetical protein
VGFVQSFPGGSPIIRCDLEGRADCTEEAAHLRNIGRYLPLVHSGFQFPHHRNLSNRIIAAPLFPPWARRCCSTYAVFYAIATYINRTTTYMLVCAIVDESQ